MLGREVVASGADTTSNFGVCSSEGRLVPAELDLGFADTKMSASLCDHVHLADPKLHTT